MGATIEYSLYIGLNKTRFDLFDDVKLKLKNGTIIEGEIAAFEENYYIYIENEEGTHTIHVDDIDDYVT